MAVMYITIGALLGVWSVIYFIYISRRGALDPDYATDASYLWCLGFFLSGMVLIGIGLLVGRIGRSAREAEVVSGVPDPQAAAAPAAPANGIPLSTTTPTAGATGNTAARL
jgi:hypothetical protein